MESELKLSGLALESALTKPPLRLPVKHLTDWSTWSAVLCGAVLCWENVLS